MDASPQAKETLPPLDGLRGGGALLVFVFHFLSSVPYYGLTAPPGLLRVSTHLAVLSVDVFFAVSGFMLFGSLERIRAGTPNTPLTLDFYIRRFFRIVPLWWLVLTIELFRQRLGPGVYLANATFLFGFLSHDVRYLPILVAWTLFAEMSFYALLPGFFRWLRGVTSAVAFLVLMVAVARLWERHAVSLGVPSSNHFIDDFPLSCFKYFAVGILVRFLYRKLPAGLAPWLDAAAVAAVVVTTLTLRFVTPAVLLLLLATLAPGSRLAGWIAVRPLAFVGVHCYFVYLTHNQLFIEPMLDLFLRAPTPVPSSVLPGAGAAWLAFVLALALCLAAASVSMRVFEAPMVGMGKRIAARLLVGARSRQASASVDADRAA
jgi:peptidoglycan/LPS O-acetylase OafA/YrhL